MIKPDQLEITNASWHRNGIGGAGFYAILFNDKENGPMVASLFDKPGYCAVYNVEELIKGNIQFAMGNSWRGDEFEDALRPLLEEFIKENGGNRVGPFGVPDLRTKEDEKKFNEDLEKELEELKCKKSL